MQAGIFAIYAFPLILNPTNDSARREDLQFIVCCGSKINHENALRIDASQRLLCDASSRLKHTTR